MGGEAGLSNVDIQFNHFAISRWVSTYREVLSTADFCTWQCPKNSTTYSQIPGAKHDCFIFQEKVRNSYSWNHFSIQKIDFQPAHAEEKLQIPLNRLADDLLELQTTGFSFQGETWHIACLGVKGDQPFLRTAGGFIRHWQRAVRVEKDNANPPGVCWLCLAGTRPGGPFEDFNMNAQWANVPTVVPWVVTPSLLKLFHCPDHTHDYFKTDVWHNYHGGAGRSFIASVLAECLTLLDGSVADKISQLDSLLHVWAKRPDCKLPHSGPFTAERIGLTSLQVLPEGTWSKFADTYVYHKFVEWFLSERLDKVRADPILLMSWEAVCIINKTFTILYTSGLWLTSHEARAAGEGGRKWLALYARLAHTCFLERRLRFPVYVKFHMLDHSWRRLLAGSRNQWTLNILCESVQADEESIFDIG